MNVACKNLRKTAWFLAVTFILTMYFVSLAAGRTLNVPDGKSVHFSTTVYVSTSGTAMHIQQFFVGNTFNYTVDSAGTQLIHNGSEPTAVYIDGALGTEGVDYTYSSGTIIITSATTSGSIFYGTAPIIPIIPTGMALAAPSGAIVFGENFTIQLVQDQNIGFQGDGVLTITAASPTVQCIYCNTTVYSSTGYLDMQPITDTIFTVSTSSIDVYLDLQGSGGSLVSSGNATWIASMLGGNSYRLVWGWTIPSMLDLYANIGLGLAGIGMMIFGLGWPAWEIKEHGLTDEAVKRMFFLLIIGFVGLGLFMMWVMG